MAHALASSRARCWGSMRAASEGVMPIAAASKSAHSLTKPPKRPPILLSGTMSASQRSRGMEAMASWLLVDAATGCGSLQLIPTTAITAAPGCLPGAWSETAPRFLQGKIAQVTGVLSEFHRYVAPEHASCTPGRLSYSHSHGLQLCTQHGCDGGHSGVIEYKGARQLHTKDFANLIPELHSPCAGQSQSMHHRKML